MKLKKGLAYLVSATTLLSALFAGTAMAAVGNIRQNPVIRNGVDDLLRDDLSGSEYEKIKDLTLHIVSPEENSVQVKNLPSSVTRFFIFCNAGVSTTFEMIESLSDNLAGTAGVEIYCLGFEKELGSFLEERIQAADFATPCYFCVDKDDAYEQAALSVAQSNSGTVVLLLNSDRKTVVVDYGRDGRSYGKDLASLITDNAKIYAYTGNIFMYPGMEAMVPLTSLKGLDEFKSSNQNVATVDTNGIIHALSPGTTNLTSAPRIFCDRSVNLTVLSMKDNKNMEWEALKEINRIRMEAGDKPLSTTEMYEKAADIRAHEIGANAGRQYSRMRPGDRHFETVFDEFRSPSASSGVKYWHNVAEISANMGSAEQGKALADRWNHPENGDYILDSGMRIEASHVGIMSCDGSRSNSMYAASYFGDCSGTNQNITLVSSRASQTLKAGESLSDLGYELSLTCSVCGAARMPVIDAMCQGFDPAKAGQQEITVSFDGWSDTFTVNVEAVEKKTVESITVTPASLSLKVGETGNLSASVSPKDADDTSVEWRSADTSVAFVNAQGRVTAAAAGETEIYCASKDGGNVRSNSCKVTVSQADNTGSAGGTGSTGGTSQPDKKEVESITVSPTSMTIRVGASRKVTATVKPSDADDKSVTWHSTNPSVAEVEDDGTVTGIAKGTAEIYCVSDDNGTESKHCKVTVTTSSSSGGGGSSSSSGGSSSGGGSGSSGSSGSGGSSSSRSSGSSSPSSSGSASLPSYVVRGTWSQGGDGRWRFTDTAGTLYVNAWAAVENPYANTSAGQQAFDWFRFDEAGNMVTGWYQDPADGRWYYLNPTSDGTLGRMITGWYVIDGAYYYFNPNSDGCRGRMYANETTPDNYYVDASGRWVQ